ncbi:phospholemman isoform X1 [Alosa sapidissima]|nr:phospholemman isoform X1 [Alosa sapidissima]
MVGLCFRTLVGGGDLQELQTGTQHDPARPHTSRVTIGYKYSCMQSAMARIFAAVFFTLVSFVLAEERGPEKPEDDPFTFDYYRLRVGGLILAAVLCLIGFTILLSGRCRCKFNQDKRRKAGSSAAGQQMLNDAARASEC